MNRERQLLLSMLYLDCEDDASCFLIDSRDEMMVRDSKVKCVVTHLFMDRESML